MARFDRYAKDYKSIINNSASLSGEVFEYFINVRVGLIKSHLYSEPVKILDFGCGIGETEKMLRAAFPGSSIVGIDESKKSIAAARKHKLRGVRFIATAEVPHDAFDLIYSNGTFHHIPRSRHKAVLKKLFLGARKGASIFIFENNPYNPLMMHAMRKNPFDKGTRALTPFYLRGIMKETGFRIEKTCFYLFFPKFLKGLRPLEKRLGWLPLGAQYFVLGRKD